MTMGDNNTFYFLKYIFGATCFLLFTFLSHPQCIKIGTQCILIGCFSMLIYFKIF